MFKIWLQALRGQALLIAQNPAAAYGATMTALVVFLLVSNVKTGRWLLEDKDARISDKTQQVEVITNWGQMLQRAQTAEQEWRDTAREVRRDNAYLQQQLADLKAKRK